MLYGEASSLITSEEQQAWQADTSRSHNNRPGVCFAEDSIAEKNQELERCHPRPREHQKRQEKPFHISEVTFIFPPDTLMGQNESLSRDTENLYRQKDPPTERFNLFLPCLFLLPTFAH